MGGVWGEVAYLGRGRSPAKVWGEKAHEELPELHVVLEVPADSHRMYSQ